jgi:hypothetical protein
MTTDAETKEIVCITPNCGIKFGVLKWSANKQKCDKCKGVGKSTTNEDTLIQASNSVLSTNDFILGTYGWYKQYSGTNVVYQLEPKFDKGIFVDKKYDVIGFIVHKQEYIHTDEIKSLKDLPKEMIQDMNKISSKLSNYIVKKSDNAVDKVACDACGEKVAEWIEIGQQYICLKKCFMKRMKK